MCKTKQMRYNKSKTGKSFEVLPSNVTNLSDTV